ncbi:plant synaptotagmin [Selaginella moellendorffii]|uniref:Plant synaptotagmin n=1 Tax=Selaginella moellendorffii TaxID=88036 RepID=D8REK1_SELML|nr:uncharacterized protein LOC9660637 isoform X1 [Selaginella moellendorffii]EFJ29672.1 plant synaptotagmin [Selaginella moellendorffii]|eukprot:XP_002969584.1 uncharacterized protein LOC9660637 isoform X1 [Selaginella moellendorffii]
MARNQFVGTVIREANGVDYGRFLPRQYVGSGGRRHSSEFTGVWQHLIRDKPILPFLIPVFLLAWALERWIVPFSNWVPVCVTVWATIQYGRYRQQQIVEDLNNRWKRHFLCTQPTTPLEPCEWFNKLVLCIWPNYLEKRLSSRFRTLVQRRVKEKKPRPIQTIEVHDFDLGKAPPLFGLQRTFWSLEDCQPVLHMGFEWVSNEMSVLLAAKLSAPFAGKVARININSIQVRGDLRLVPILDGQAILYAFESTPDVKLGVAFGSGNQHLPATELPVVSSWLEKLLLDTLNRTMVEPRMRCFSLPVRDSKKRVTGGVLSVSVLTAANIPRPENSSRMTAGDRYSSNGSSFSGTFVELTLGNLSRRTGTSPKSTWDAPITMVFHGSEATLHLNVYEQRFQSVKSDFLGTCEIKFKYVFDGSTTFWAVGRKPGVIAAHVDQCDREVQLVVPIEDKSGEITVKLVLKEWCFADDPKNSQTPLLQLDAFRSTRYLTGRKIKVTVVEGRNLAPKDRSGKSDPYLKLQYNKIQRKTKTIQQNLNPVWNQEFEFDEYGDGEYIKIKCYDADMLMNDENMGSARINLHSLEANTPRDVWIPLEKIDTGEIHLLLEAVDTRDSETEDHNMTYILELILVEARDLVAADWNGTSDPYVSVRYGTVRKRTKVIYRSLSPLWNETMDLIDDGSPLELHVKDYNAILPTASIGHCAVDYQRQARNQTVDRWIPLQGVAKGQIHIQITRRELRKQEHPPAIERQRSSRVEEVSGRVQEVVSRLFSMVDSEDVKDQMQAQLEELVNAEQEQKVLVLQLLKEKELLLSKVKDLQRAMTGLV